MNRKKYTVWAEWKKKQQKVDLEELQNDIANRGMTFSGMREQAERHLNEKYDTEIEMERLVMEEEEREKKEKQRERYVLIGANIILALTAFASIWFSTQTYKLSTDENRKLNRPYLQIENPIFEFYGEDGEQINHAISSEKIKFFKLMSKTVNHGNIPAEVVEKTIEVPKLNFYKTTQDPYTIYDYMKSPTSLIQLEQDINSWFANLEDEFTVKVVEKYRISGMSQIYEASNESVCRATRVEGMTDINCYLISAGTN